LHLVKLKSKKNIEGERFYMQKQTVTFFGQITENLEHSGITTFKGSNLMDYLFPHGTTMAAPNITKVQIPKGEE